MKYLLAALFIFAYICKPDIGYSQNSPLYTHFLYMFAHAGFIHLIINLISFLSLFSFLSKVIPPVWLFLYSYLSAVFASFFSSGPQPTVGASGMVCGLIAIYAILPLLGKKLIIQNRKKYLLWIIYTSIALITSFFFTSVNSANHFFALLAGAIFSVIDHWISYKNA